MSLEGSQRRSAQELFLAALLILVVLVTGTEAGRLATVLRAMGALVGAIVVLWYLVEIPRDSDSTDRLVLAGLLVFLVTCVTSSALRSSFDAATSAVAYAASYYIARRAVATPAGLRLALTVLAALGTVIGALVLVAWGAIWVRWVTLSGGGLPPLDLKLPAFLWGHQYPVGMLAAVLLPASAALVRRPVIGPMMVVGCAGAVLIAFMSGGRGIWIAGFGAFLVGAIVARGFRLPFTSWRVRFLTLAGVAAVLVAVAIPLLPRLVTTSTIELRLAIWVAAIGRWLESPIVGLGPGSFAHEFTLSGYYRTYEANVPHAHNLLVQVLFESGVLGLLAVGLICIAVIRAMADRGRLEWAPVTAIAFLVFASSTDNPSVVPVLIAPLIVWTAAATPRLRDKGARRAAARRPLILAAASVVALASLATHVAAWSFENARAASARGDTATVITELSRATLLDPAFALYHRELGVWLQSNGSSNIAERELRSAIRLNASDTQGYRALALLLAKSGDETRAIEWASRADHMQATNAQNALTLAYVAAELGDRATEQAALVSAVRRYPWIMAAPEWTDIFPEADLDRIVADAIDSWSGDGASPRTARAQAWLAGFAGVDPPATTTHAQRVESATLACRSQVASDVLNELEGRAASRIDALEARLIFGRAYGGKDVGAILALMRLRDPGQAQLASLHASGTSPVSNAFYDDRYYDRIAIPPPPGPTFPTPASGLSAWLTDPIAAADRGAPMSALAACR